MYSLIYLKNQMCPTWLWTINLSWSYEAHKKYDKKLVDDDRRVSSILLYIVHHLSSIEGESARTPIAERASQQYFIPPCSYHLSCLRHSSTWQEITDYWTRRMGDNRRIRALTLFSKSAKIWLKVKERFTR